MLTTKMPSPDRTQFDAICATVEDWEVLPTVTVPPADPAQDDPEEDQPVDELILAGLVMPY